MILYSLYGIRQFSVPNTGFPSPIRPEGGEVSKLWDAIAQWRSAGQQSHPEDWPVVSGVPGEEAVKRWRDPSAGREVSLA